MARGHQKAQSQAKTLEKTAKAKKQQGHSATEQKKAAQKALVISCSICKVSIFPFIVIVWEIQPILILFSHGPTVSDARSEDIQTAFRKQASKERIAS